MFSIVSALVYKISFRLLTLGFFISSFSSYFRCRVRLFIWLFSCFLRYACITMNFPLSTAFIVSHRFCCVFIFVRFYAYFDFFFDFFCGLLVIQQRVVQLPYVGIFNNFSPVIEIALWSEKMLGMISIFFNSPRLDLWPRMWSILEKVPCAL